VIPAPFTTLNDFKPCRPGLRRNNILPAMVPIMRKTNHTSSHTTRVSIFFTFPCLLILFASIFCFTFVGTVAGAQDDGQNQLFGNRKEPVDIISDTLDFDQKKQVATFTGNIKARQGDTTLSCDTLKIYFTGPGKKLKEIIATGTKVTINLQRKKGVCRKMHYFADDNKIVLSGNPSLDDGKNIITGETITFYLDEKRSVVKSGKNRRVKTTIFPGQKNGLGWQ